jgi:thiamine-phosphate pyrophosphorylase
VLGVNDYWELAIELGCKWIHLGQEDLDNADMDKIHTAGLKFGISTHDREELDRALALAPDYIALGPVYPTILKKMKWHQQGIEKLTKWKSLIGDLPLVAIGGMSLERADGALFSGADIIAAVTDITFNNDPESRVQEWLEVLK